MRKVILSMMVSLDGFIEDSNKQIDWHVWDEEMSRYMTGFFEGIDTILFGRVTYQMMADFWPTPAAGTEDPIIADRMNRLPKIVFSKTLEKVAWGQWNNVSLVKGNIVEEIAELRQQPGKDMVIFGGASLAATFIHLDVIDEYQIIINPVVLGHGTPLFQGIKERFGLALTGTQTFGCGNVALNYQKIRKEIIRQIHSEIKETTDQLLTMLSSLTQEQLNSVPSHGGWTAAQLGEHLLKSYAVVKTLNGKTRRTKRPVDQKITNIKKLFLDFTIKMVSPEAIVPSSGPIDKGPLINSLQKRIQQLWEIILTKDLSETCEEFAIPEYGEFTRLEWIYFCLYHTQRHIHQLNQLRIQLGIKELSVNQ